jgi:sulfur carrier protein ThiS
MHVQIDLFGLPARHVEGGRHSISIDLTVDNGATVQSVLRALKISQKMRTTVLRDGHCVKPDTAVRDGDRLCIFSPMAGG